MTVLFGEGKENMKDGRVLPVQQRQLEPQAVSSCESGYINMLCSMLYRALIGLTATTSEVCVWRELHSPSMLRMPQLLQDKWSWNGGKG